MVIILFLYLFKTQFRSNSLSSISIVNVLTGFPLDLMAYEATYNTHRTTHTTPRITIATLIDVFWSSLFGFNIRGRVFVIVDSSVLKFESLDDRVIVFVAFFNSDCGVFDAEVWANLIISNWKKWNLHEILKWYKVSYLKDIHVNVNMRVYSLVP